MKDMAADMRSRTLYLTMFMLGYLNIGQSIQLIAPPSPPPLPPVPTAITSQSVYGQYSTLLNVNKPNENGKHSSSSSLSTIHQPMIEPIKRSHEESHNLRITSQQFEPGSSTNFDEQQYNFSLPESEYYPYVNHQYYLRSPYYSSIEGSSTNGLMMSPSLSDPYTIVLSANQSASSKNKIKPGLGRRIGELVSTSAERASRAFKTFSQFKLFNDIKPSRLFGLVSEQQQPQINGIKPFNISGLPISSTNNWLMPQSSNSWSTFMSPSSSSSVFVQQPVFVRTQEANQNSALMTPAVGPLNSLLSPSSASPGPLPISMHGSKGIADYMSSMSEFYAPKISIESPPVYQSMSSPSPNNGASNAMMPPLNSGSSPVYHNFPTNSNSQTNNGNGQSPPHDLFAAPQTQFGLRVKPPKDFDFEGSNEEEMSSSNEQDDAKMADNGSNDRNGDRGANSNNEGSPNGEVSQSQGPPNSNSQWSGSAPFEEFPGESTNGPEPEIFPPYEQNGGVRLNRPFVNDQAQSNRNRPNSFRPMPLPRPFHTLTPARRPMPMPEFEEPDNWYNTFFGSNVKPITRIRSLPFGNSAMNFVPHSHPQGPSSMLNPAASTSSPTSLTMDNFMSPYMLNSMRPAEPSFFHYPATARPTWPFGSYSQPSATSSYYNNFRVNPLLPASSSIRPVAIPYYPASSYYLPRYAVRSQPMYGSYGYPPPSAYQPAAAPLAPSSLMVNPYQMNRFTPMVSPFSSMMASSSSLYPVRIPYSPLTAMPYGMSSPAVLPFLRYRYGADMTPNAARRNMNITKRADLWENNSSSLRESQKTKSISEHDAIKFIPNNTTTSESPTPKEQQKLATMYNAYQVLQRRMEQEQQENTNNLEHSYYQYYVGRETSTIPSSVIETTDSFEMLESSARTDSLNGSSVEKSHKPRHIENSKHNQDEISKYLAEKPSSITTTSTTSSTLWPSATIEKSKEQYFPPTLARPSFSGMQARQAKAVSESVNFSKNQWRPLKRIITTIKKSE